MADTRFKPGQSGNPAGRKPLPEALKARLRDLSDKAVDALVAALDDQDARVRLAAANSLLDRAWGKPPQQQDINVTQAMDASQAHLQALVTLARRREEETRQRQVSANADAEAGSRH